MSRLQELTLSLALKCLSFDFVGTLLDESSEDSVDEDAKEKLAPYSALSSDESYSNRDLEKISLDISLMTSRNLSCSLIGSLLVVQNQNAFCKNNANMII
ncbi:hypothetical protein Syun_014043 [Stephania yunnanensis]|uniref:Uncharacterized protein n=1 Tax=Stephania yunnanensis TaxID=152371 RepID=A0AAP0JIJ3_9MAGN